MKNIFFFSALLLLIFSACQQDDFPTINPPKLAIKNVANIDGKQIFDFTYQDGLVDSIIFPQTRSKFNVSYTDKRVTGMRESFRSSPTDTLQYRDYFFEYKEQKIIVKYTLQIGVEETRDVIRTYYLNETGNHVNKIELNMVKFTQDTIETLLANDLYEYTWDEDGKNIMEMKQYVITLNDPTAPRILSGTFEYTYDENPSPYFGMMRPFFPHFFEAYFMSENNVKTQEYTSQSNMGFSYSLNFEYTYGKKGFPEMLTRSSPATDFTHVFEYEE